MIEVLDVAPLEYVFGQRLTPPVQTQALNTAAFTTAGRPLGSRVDAGGVGRPLKLASGVVAMSIGDRSEVRGVQIQIDGAWYDLREGEVLARAVKPETIIMLDRLDPTDGRLVLEGAQDREDVCSLSQRIADCARVRVETVILDSAFGVGNWSLFVKRPRVASTAGAASGAAVRYSFRLSAGVNVAMTIRTRKLAARQYGNDAIVPGALAAEYTGDTAIASPTLTQNAVTHGEVFTTRPFDAIEFRFAAGAGAAQITEGQVQVLG